MLDVLASFALVLLIAWIGRALVGATGIGWGRLLLAALMGIAFGDSVALFLMATDLSQVGAVDIRQLQFISMPFRVIGTMGAILVLELMFRRARRAPAERGAGPSRRLRAGRMLRPAVLIRAFKVSRILTRHGFAPLIGWTRGRGDRLEAHELARRARQAFEEAGGVFIKLGQLLATRPDLLPPAALSELAKLQSAVAPLEQESAEAAIRSALDGEVEEVFASIDWEPLGSASIAQVHKAELMDGSQVVIKVRRPGLEQVILRDLTIVRWLARTAERRLGWARRLGVVGLADEFAEALLIELDFRTEARHVDEVASAVREEGRIHVPRVHHELTAPSLIVMERLEGRPLSQLAPGERVAGSEGLADALCTSQVRSMLDGERFHGDPHPGNLILLEDGRLGLVDLGLSSKLDAFERAAVFQMLLALRQEQPSLLYESMVTIGAVDQAVHDRSDIERALARFMAAYLGPGLPPAEALTDLLRLTLTLGLRLPPSTSAMFRALSTLMGSLELLHPGYPVIDKIVLVGGAEFRRRLLPSSAAEFIRQEWTELGPLLARLPHHVDRLATLAEHGRLSFRTRVLADAEDRGFVERLLNRFVLSLLSVGVGAVSVMLLGTEGGFEFPLAGVGLYEVLGWTGLFIAMSLLFRVLLAVLSSEAAAR